jgi:hypothetical protein
MPESVLQTLEAAADAAHSGANAVQQSPNTLQTHGGSSSSSASQASSGEHTPKETSDRSQTPTHGTSGSQSSAAASPLGAQVEGKPSPPPGLSPHSAQQQMQQQFQYNGRQVQVQSPQQMAAQQLLLQQHAQFQQALFQQQMAQQQLLNGQRATRVGRQQNRPPQFPPQFYPQGPMYPPMSFEMYQQMLYSSGTMDAATFAQSMANGAVWSMYQLACANAVGQANAGHMHAAQMPQAPFYGAPMGTDPYASLPHQVTYYGPPENMPTPPPQHASPPPPAPQQQQQNAHPAGFAYGAPIPSQSPSNEQQHQQQQQQQQHPSHRHFRGDSHSLSNSANSVSGRHRQQPSFQGEQANFPEEPVQRSERRHRGGHDGKAPTPNTYKTEICRSHQANGTCEYGSSCQFSHGAHELRSREVDSKYKTELYVLALDSCDATRCAVC